MPKKSSPAQDEPTDIPPLFQGNAPPPKLATPEVSKDGKTPFVPVNINELELEEVLTLYLDWGLKLQPNYPWDADCVDPGKQPRWSTEHRLRATKSEIIRHYRDHPNDNVGLVPMPPFVGIDIDDPPGNRWRCIKEVMALYPELLKGPYTKAVKGPHILVVCPDIHPGAPCKHEAKDFRGTGGNIELFLGSASNLVMPPSIHPSSTPEKLVRYRRVNSGPWPVIAYARLLEMFDFKAGRNGDQHNGDHPEKDHSWLKAFKGNLATLDIVALCEELDIYGKEIGYSKDGDMRHSVRCPWTDEHTEESEWTPRNSSTAVFVNEAGGIPGFLCMHSHCAERGLQAFLQWTEAQKAGIVDRHCKEKFHPKSKAQAPKGGSLDQEEAANGNKSQILIPTGE
jgi:hypothetical protein